MRAHFGGYFLGQVITFGSLVQSAAQAENFNVAEWPQFSIYNLVVANFWPLYWVAYLYDSAKLDEAYWHVYAVAGAKVGDVMMFFGAMGG